LQLGLLGIFTAGILTVFTPCVLPLLPVYLSVLLGSPLAAAGEISGRARMKLVAGAVLFSAGFTAVFTLLGLSATALGVFLIKVKVYLSLFGGLVILLMGLKFVGWLKVSFLEREARLDGARLGTRLPLLGAFIMGVVFALGWTPCIGPVLGAVLTYAASQSTRPGQGALMLALYGLGFSVPLLVLALFAASAARLVAKISRYLGRVEQVLGVLLVASGLYLMAQSVGVPGSGTAPGFGGDARVSKVKIDPPLGEPTKKPRIVEFYSIDCSICMSMVPTVRAMEEECGRKGVDILKIEVGGKEGKELASRLAIRGVPTFLFFGTDGKEVARLVGYQTPQSLRQTIGTMLGDDRCGGVELLPAPRSEAPACNDR
jgi:cytochrome c-type biogenesis protein